MKKILAICTVLFIAAGAYGQTITDAFEINISTSDCSGIVDIQFNPADYPFATVSGYLFWTLDGQKMDSVTDSLHWSAHLSTGIHVINITVKNQNGISHSYTKQFISSEDVSIILHDTICQGETYTKYGLQTKPDTTTFYTLYHNHALDCGYSVNLATIDSINYGFGFVVIPVYREATMPCCDSIVTLKLTVNPVYFCIVDTVTVFTGEFYNGHSQEKYYQDTLKTACGCDSIVRYYLKMTIIPNTITPNGDGINDVFMPGRHVQIYTRNGLLLHDGTDGWDGTYKGKPVARDTYFYVLYYQSAVGLRTKNGYVVVAR